jgi:hypothetical protein
MARGGLRAAPCDGAPAAPRSLRRRTATGIVTLALAALPAAAYAAHPLTSEDTGTQGARHVELELGMSRMRADGGRTVEVDPQLSYGVTDALDVIVRPSLFLVDGAVREAAGRSSGAGPVALDLKWRFTQAGAWSAGLRAGLDTPAIDHGLGPRQGGAHALAMVTYEQDGLLLTANAAYSRRARDDGSGSPQRRNLPRVSMAAIATASESVRLVADLAVQRSDDPDDRRWPAVLVLGTIVRVAGVDVDLGYQARLNRAAPAGVWLAGVTLRW